MDIAIGKLTSAQETMVPEINSLLGQLKGEFTPLTFSALQNTVDDSHCVFIVARDGERIVGMASLFTLNTLLKTKGYVEDVVVDAGQQGKGLGTKIMQALIDEAKELGIGEIELTSRPSREAANKLYQKLGFEKRDTNIYRLKLS